MRKPNSTKDGGGTLRRKRGPAPTNLPQNSMRYRFRLRGARFGGRRKVAADAHVARREAPAAIPQRIAEP
jgi:hypothetical protein